MRPSRCQQDKAEFQTISPLTRRGDGGETTSTKSATLLMIGSCSEWQVEFPDNSN